MQAECLRWCAENSGAPQSPRMHAAGTGTSGAARSRFGTAGLISTANRFEPVEQYSRCPADMIVARETRQVRYVKAGCGSSGATPTFSTRGSVRRCGRSVRWGGRTERVQGSKGPRVQMDPRRPLGPTNPRTLGPDPRTLGPSDPGTLGPCPPHAGRPRLLLPHQHARDRARDHHAVGSAHGHDRAVLHEARAVSARAHPPRSSRTASAAR